MDMQQTKTSLQEEVYVPVPGTTNPHCISVKIDGHDQWVLGKCDHSQYNIKITHQQSDYDCDDIYEKAGIIEIYRKSTFWIYHTIYDRYSDNPVLLYVVAKRPNFINDETGKVRVIKDIYPYCFEYQKIIDGDNKLEKSDCFFVTTRDGKKYIARYAENATSDQALEMVEQVNEAKYAYIYYYETLIRVPHKGSTIFKTKTYQCGTKICSFIDEDDGSKEYLLKQHENGLFISQLNDCRQFI